MGNIVSGNSQRLYLSTVVHEITCQTLFFCCTNAYTLLQKKYKAHRGRNKDPSEEFRENEVNSPLGPHLV